MNSKRNNTARPCATSVFQDFIKQPLKLNNKTKLTDQKTFVQPKDNVKERASRTQVKASKPVKRSRVDKVAGLPATAIQTFQQLSNSKTTAGKLFATIWKSIAQTNFGLCFEVNRMGAVMSDSFFAVLEISKIVCGSERVVRDHEVADDDDDRNKENAKRGLKNVAFRCYDLSNFKFDYEENSDSIAKCLREMLDFHLKLLSVHSELDKGAQSLLRLMISRMQDRKLLLQCENAENSAIQIQRAACFFAREFEKLLDKPMHFYLHLKVSELFGSYVRHLLRELFKDESEPDGTEFGNFKDIGAAVHRALNDLEAHSYAMTILNQGKATPEVQIEKKENIHADDIDSITRYILAHKFLRKALQRLQSSIEEADTRTGVMLTETQREIESLCQCINSHQFFDEMHLCPLSSIDKFLKSLVLDSRIIQSTDSWLLKHAGEGDHAGITCGECNKNVKRSNSPGIIICSSCDKAFHLSCLHLPPEFAKFSVDFLCPQCLLR